MVAAKIINNNQRIPVKIKLHGNNTDHISIPYSSLNIQPFREGWAKADYHCVEYLERGMPEKLNDRIISNYLYSTRMNFAGLKKPQDRANMIAYLRQQADAAAALPTAEEIAAESES